MQSQRKIKTGREKEKEQEIIRKFVSAICCKILTTWHSVQSSRRCMLNKRGILSSSGFRFFSTHQGGQEGQTLFFQLRPKMCQAKGGEESFSHIVQEIQLPAMYFFGTKNTHRKHVLFIAEGSNSHPDRSMPAGRRVRRSSAVVQFGARGKPEAGQLCEIQQSQQVNQL